MVMSMVMIWDSSIEGCGSKFGLDLGFAFLCCALSGYCPYQILLFAMICLFALCHCDWPFSFGVVTACPFAVADAVSCLGLWQTPLNNTCIACGCRRSDSVGVMELVGMLVVLRVLLIMVMVILAASLRLTVSSKIANAAWQWC